MKNPRNPYGGKFVVPEGTEALQFVQDGAVWWFTTNGGFSQGLHEIYSANSWPRSFMYVTRDQLEALRRDHPMINTPLDMILGSFPPSYREDT